MPRRPATHPCAAPDCGAHVPAGRLMCRTHWFALPAALRTAIGATWRSRRRAEWLANVREAQRLLGGEDDRDLAPAPPSDFGLDCRAG